jgi:electron transfer flavoprotein alpha subunit
MKILVFLDHADGHIRKASLEAACYAADIARQNGGTAEAVVLGSIATDLTAMGQYGISKVYALSHTGFNEFDAQVHAKAIAQVAETAAATVIVFSNNIAGKAIAPRLSVRLQAGLVSGAVALPDTSNGFVVKKNVFSGKAFANVSINTPKKIVTLNPNAYSTVATAGVAVVENLDIAADAAKIQVTANNKVEGDVPLTEAEIVVSGGRGLKGPENWGLVTDLAKVLGAATACSRPVADVHWRPHHEHVGQTGIAIAPNLYIAIGISGAIQHLAGVNRSKTIVVINKDPEAPFFKAADYGIVGDAFEVVPKITAAIQKLKNS